MKDPFLAIHVKPVDGARMSIGGPYVGSLSVDLARVGRGTLLNITAAEAVEAEQISYARFWAHNGCDLLVKKERTYLFRLIYPHCGWVRADELPPMYQEIANAWLKLRRRGTI